MLKKLSRLGQPQSNTQERFYRELVVGDMNISGGKTSYTAGKWTKAGYYTVPPQTSVHWGYGTPNEGMGQNQGFLYVKLLASPSGGDIEGSVRLTQENAAGTRKITVFEGRTESLDGSTSDKNSKIAFTVSTSW